MDKQDRETLDVNIKIAEQSLKKIKTYIDRDQKQKAVTSLKEVIHNLERTIQDVGGKLQIIQDDKKEETKYTIMEVINIIELTILGGLMAKALFPLFQWSIVLGAITGLIGYFAIRETIEKVIGDKNN